MQETGRGLMDLRQEIVPLHHMQTVSELNEQFDERCNGFLDRKTKEFIKNIL